MSATTFLLILAAVVVVFVGFAIRSWSALSSATRGKRRGGAEKEEAGDPDKSGDGN